MINKSYAQLGQDLLAVHFFKHYPPSQKVFLDVGAFDGIGFSNTRLLFEQGWSGICVEPVLKNYLKLQKLYSDTNVTTMRAAAADFEGEMTLNVATIPWARDWGSDVSSPTDDVVERWPDYIWEKEIVLASTVNRILEQNSVIHIDYVSIDVEGHEMSVLRGFDLQKYQPHLLVVEYSTPIERQDLILYMKHQGYFSWIDNGQDIFFVYGSALEYWKVLPSTIWVRFSASKLGQYVIRNVKWFIK